VSASLSIPWIAGPAPRLTTHHRTSPVVTQIGMPHLDIAGLSESWLFRHAGHLHWTAIHESLGIAADELRNDRDERLYASFVAIRARYEIPLCEVREDDRLVAHAVMSPCGRTAATSEVTLRRDTAALRLSMASTFAAFVDDGAARALRASPLAPALAQTWPPLGAASPLHAWAKDARRGQPVEDALWATALGADQASLGRVRLTPSPYGDYNHAGLLYFASYVGLADTAEHLLLSPGGPAASAAPRQIPWWQQTSTVARDVLYYRNLPCGEPLDAELVSLTPADDAVATHVRLFGARDGRLLADVLTSKTLR